MLIFTSYKMATDFIIIQCSSLSVSILVVLVYIDTCILLLVVAYLYALNPLVNLAILYNACYFSKQSYTSAHHFRIDLVDVCPIVVVLQFVLGLQLVTTFVPTLE